MLALFAYTVKEYPGFVRTLLLLFCFTACIGKGYTLRGGMGYNNILHSVNTIQYTFRNAEVCHYSVVNPTAYDERLLTYWSYYPEKEPDIIVIDCWFGNMLFPEDSWIVRYIEQNFDYTEMIEGNYVRIYKK